MADTMELWTPVVIDLKADRDRINTPRLFNKKQRKVLLKMIDLFEEGNLCYMIEESIQEENKALFDYPIFEYLPDVYYDVIMDMSRGKVYKRKENI
jgi:hypothetical protein